MRGNALGILAAAILAIAVGAWVLFSHPHASSPTDAPAATSTQSSLIRFTPGLERWYLNETLRFSFRLPDGFSAPEPKLTVPGEAVDVHNELGDRLTITATPLPKGAALMPITEETLRAGSPGETITNVRKGALGETGIQGEAFTTDAPLWGGEGAGFWFIRGGYLYKLATYQKDQELLDLVLSTWRFGDPTPESAHP